MKKTKTTKPLKAGKAASGVPETAPRTATAVVRYLRIGPRKVRIVINAVRYKPAYEALMILKVLKKKAARLAEKLLTSAIANAKVKGLELDKLYISEVRADGGPVMKRFMERSMGRANRILKRTTHLSLELKEGKRSVGIPPETPGAKKAQKIKEKKAAAAKA